MLRPAALALLGLVFFAGCGGNSAPFSEGEGGEASGAESSGGSSGTSTNGGASGTAGTSAGGVGVGGSSGASGAGGTNTGGVTNGGTGVGGSDMGGTDAGGTDAGGSGGAQGGDAGRAGSGAVAGASGSTGTGGTGGATMTDPRCPVREPASGDMCAPVGLRCPYDPGGCRCLSILADRCFQIDTGCFAMAPGTGDRIAPPPAHYCTCSAIPDRPTPGWTCAPLPQ